MNKVNVPLLRKVLEHITEHPEEWDQDYWGMRRKGCGTTFCLAGHAVVMAGHQIDWRRWIRPQTHFDDHRPLPTALATKVEDGRYISVVAADELGLQYGQMTRLFHGENNLAYLWKLANEFTNGEIEIPEGVKA